MPELPGAASVQKVRRGRDPGLNVPANFGSEVGEVLVDAGQQISRTAVIKREKAQILRDGNFELEHVAALDSEITLEFQRRQQQEDTTAPDFVQKFDGFVQQRASDVINRAKNAGVSETGILSLQRRLAELRSGFTAGAGRVSAVQQAKKAEDLFKGSVNALASRVRQDPAALPVLLGEIDDSLQAYRGALDPAAEREARDLGRANLIGASIRGFVERKNIAGARRVLSAEEFEDDIDPATRERLSAVIDGAERERDALLADEVSDALFVLDRGRVPSNFESLENRTRGTKFEADLRAALEDSDDVAAFARKPLSEQRTALRASAGQPTTTARGLRLQEREARAHAHIVTEIGRGNGLAVAGEVGVISEPNPIDLGDPATLKNRAAKAKVASRHFGMPISPLTPAETDKVAERITQESPDVAVGTIASLTAGLGQDGAAQVAAEVSKKRPATAMAIITATDRPLLAREIVNGERLLEEHRDVAPSKADRQGAVEDVVGNLFAGTDATALAPVLSAASAIYANRRVPGGELGYDADMYEQALHDAVGGILEHNDRNIIAPRPGMSQGQFDDLIDAIKPEDLVRFGNGAPVYGNGDPFDPTLLGSSSFGTEAQLVTSGFDGHYMVFAGGGFLLTETGEPYEIDLRALAASGRTK